MGALSAEVVTLAEACGSALWGGVSWRELMAGAFPEERVSLLR